MKMLLGAIIGALAAWFYSSERARQSVAATAAEGAQRVAEAIDSAPLPDPVKGTASDAAFNLWAAADQVGRPSGESRLAS
jgi:hypothetical protein